MNAKYLAVLLFFGGALGQHANATVLALHENAEDPESEGWAIRSSGDMTGLVYPILDDNGSGVDAWAIDDSSDSVQPGYRVQLTPQDIDDGLSMGWKLSAQLRVVDVPEALDFTSVQVLVGNGSSSHFGMSFNMESDGSPLVNVGWEHAPVIIDLDDLDSGYHLYELEFDPTTHQAGLFVDGALRASSIEAFPSYIGSAWETSVNFGSTYKAGFGHANYSLVKYEIMEPLLGDANLDGEVNGLDVDPFVEVLLNGPYQPEADMNEDQVVNGLDVDPFVAAVVGGTQAVPEPSALLLAFIALSITGALRKRGV